MKDPTEPIRVKAGQYAGVDEGAACTQSSFKAGGTAFLFIGEQGGRYKAMFKLKASKTEAAALAKKAPEDFQLGTGAWVTARFSAEHPLPTQLWKKWLDESYALSTNKNAVKPRAKKKKTPKKRSTRQ